MNEIEQYNSISLNLKKEIMKIRNEINELTKEKRRLEVMDFSNDVYSNQCYNLSEADKKIIDELPIEHKELLIQKQNEIAELQLEYEKNLSEVQIAIKAIEALNDEETRHEIQIYDISVESDFYNIQTEFYKSQSETLEQYIKDFSTFINDLDGQIKNSNKAIAHQIELKEDVESRGGGITDTENDIKNIVEHFNTVNLEIDTINEQSQIIEEALKQDRNKHKEAMERSKQLYGFQEAKAEIQNEIEEIKRAITINYQSLNQIEQRIFTGQERFNLLKSIPSNQIAQDVPPKSTIQNLSRKLIKLRENKEERRTQLSEELAQIREENARLENHVEMAKKLLDNSQIILQPTKAILKKQIKEKKVQTGDREIKSIQKINQVKLKTPKRSGIPLPKKRR